jgi:uncharacterized protein YhdP
LRDRAQGGGAGGAVDDDVALAGVDLDVGALELFGRRFNDFKVIARHSLEDWKLELRGRDIAGTAAWSAPSGAAPNGRIVARLSRFAMPAAGDLPPERRGQADGDEGGVDTIERWPELDRRRRPLVSKAAISGARHVAQRAAAGGESRKLSVNDAELDANSAWRSGGTADTARGVARCQPRQRILAGKLNRMQSRAPDDGSGRSRGPARRRMTIRR